MWVRVEATCSKSAMALEHRRLSLSELTCSLAAASDSVTATHVGRSRCTTARQSSASRGLGFGAELCDAGIGGGAVVCVCSQ